MNEMGFFDPDLNKGNFMYDPQEEVIYRLDFENTQMLDYIENWRKLPICLMSLFRWFDQSEAAAFRFGYIQEGGPIAKEIFSIMRQQNGLTIFSYDQELSPMILEKGWSQEDRDFENEYLIWKKIRNRASRYGRITRTYKSPKLSGWFKARNRLGLQKNSEAHLFVYYRHLVFGYYNSSLVAIIEALINIAGVLKQKEIEKAFWIMQYCENLQDIFRGYINQKSRNIFDVLFNEVKQQHCPKRTQIIERIMNYEVLEFLWALDDLEYVNNH